MSFTFDHIVQFVEEPSKAIEGFKKYGLHAIEGGRHTNYGTFNTLSYFDLSYIEFLGTYDRKLVEHNEHLPHSLMETVVNDSFVEGFVRFAVRTTDIEGAARHFREKGLTVSGPTPLSRKRPDGSVLSWQLLYAGDNQGGLPLPFIIQWEESDEERRADHIAREAIKPKSTDLSFSHVTFAVNDLDDSVEKWTHVLGLKAGKKYVDERLNATCQLLQLAGGNLLFASPVGEGIVSNVLKARGERPFKVTLTGGTADETFDLLGGTYEIKKD